MTHKQKHIDLTQGPIVGQMIGMALPMLAGTFSMTTYSLAGTWFVSRLGTLPLAAMSFTFPIAMILGSVAMALGTGATVVVSQALGEGDHEKASRVSTDCLLLALVLVELLGLVGVAAMNPLLKAMNASSEVAPLTRSYLIYYLPFAGPAFLAMLANSTLRAAGDTRLSSIVMVSGAVLNCILDPILIFGWCGVPALGIVGAAIAAVISQIMTLVLSVHLLHHRYRLVARPHLKPAELLRSWGHVLKIAGPALIAFLLMPASMFIITGIVARYGEGAVAAFGAGGRVEMFAYLCPMALGISLVPLVGQNFGAGRYDRVEAFRHWSERFALGWGAVIAVVFFLAAPWLARIFATDADTQRYLVLYLRIMPFGYGLREVLRYLTIILNAISRPMASLKLNALFLAVLNVPFAIVGAWLFDVAGIFIGIVVGSNLAGVVALAYGRRHVTAATLAPAGAQAIQEGPRPV